MIEILNSREIDLMRLAGAKAANTLRGVAALITPGITTAEIDAFVRQDCLAQGCIPATLGYRGALNNMSPFPAACCTSVNEVVCHGIPGSQRLVDGDIINVDVTHIYNGYHGDTSATFYVGDVNNDVKHFVGACRSALDLAILEVKPGARLGDLGAAIQEFIEPQGFSIVTGFVGHGVGRRFHMLPNVPHVGVRGQGLRLRPGMCFTIEPMINVGRPDFRLLSDGWTVVTADGSLSSQFEHTILVTQTGVEVLTKT